MGVADNKSYKDMYHFKDWVYNVAREDNPSLEGPDKINSTIKDNPYRSNVEVEKDELILNPDLSALFKANGKGLDRSAGLLLHQRDDRRGQLYLK